MEWAVRVGLVKPYTFFSGSVHCCQSVTTCHHSNYVLPRQLFLGHILNCHVNFSNHFLPLEFLLKPQLQHRPRQMAMRAAAVQTTSALAPRGLWALYSSFTSGFPFNLPQTQTEKAPPVEPSTNLFVSGTYSFIFLQIPFLSFNFMYVFNDWYKLLC